MGRRQSDGRIVSVKAGNASGGFDCMLRLWFSGLRANLSHFCDRNDLL